MRASWYQELIDANSRAEAARESLKEYLQPTQVPDDDTPPIAQPGKVVGVRIDIQEALREIDPNLSNSYVQVCTDLSDPERIAFAGTAHEIREILSSILHQLAPDKDVLASSAITPTGPDGRVSQRDRVRYILHCRRAGSKESEVTLQLDLVEERVAQLVRSTYGRASDAAHRHKSRTEAKRILNYLEAFAHDLLNLT